MDKEDIKRGGTEPPGSGKYLYNKESGMYKCTHCGTELFSSEAKFDSGTGWPSFDQATGAVLERHDDSHGMSRTEVVCKKCGAHLGHLFNDGPTKTGARYCINSLALDFEPKEKGQ